MAGRASYDPPKTKQSYFEEKKSTMVAVTGDDDAAIALCDEAKEGDEILVAANFLIMVLALFKLERWKSRGK